MCERPTTVVLEEKNKNQSNTWHRGSFTKGPLNAALSSHLLWVTGKGELCIGKPFYSVFSALEIRDEEHFVHALDYYIWALSHFSPLRVVLLQKKLIPLIRQKGSLSTVSLCTTEFSFKQAQSLLRKTTGKFGHNNPIELQGSSHYLKIIQIPATRINPLQHHKALFRIT